MQICELFDTVRPIKFRYDYSLNPGSPALVGNFTVGDVDYVVTAVKFKRQGDTYHQYMSHLPLDNNTWFLSFSTVDGRDTDIGTGNAITVFGVVRNAFEQLIPQIRPSIIYFGCDAANEKRKRIYQKLAHGLMNIIGGHVVASEVIEFPAIDVLIWVIEQ